MMPLPRSAARLLASAAALLSLLSMPSCRTLPSGTEVRDAIVPPADVVAPHAVSGLNDVARYLAGMPGAAGSPLAPARQSEHWSRYSRNMDELWRRFSVQRQPRIAAFSRSQLGGIRNTDTLWYPFSGPDVLFADAFFPGAGTCILCGLEGSDMLPDLGALSPQERETGLDGIYTSLTTALSCSFFITKDMRVDLQRTRFRGTLPIVMVFLARLGYDIQSVQATSIDAAGNLALGQPSGACPGYTIRCRVGGRSKVIHYFTENLADFALRSDPRYLTFVSRFGSVVTYLKSASYLMHSDEFSIVRDAILRQSSAVLQDDSGIPLKAFDDRTWHLDFYGRYTGVLDIFREYYQPRLAEIYAGGGARDIDFGVGYKFETGQSALILARKQ